MISFQEALEDDGFPPVCPEELCDDADFLDGWDSFPEVALRPELRLFAGTPPDVTLLCRGGRVLQAHREVLAEVGYFNSLFHGHFREREAKSLEVDEEVEVLLEVMRWIYCQDANVDKDVVLEVMRLAEFYGIEALVDHCARAWAALSAPELQAGGDAEASGGETSTSAPSAAGSRGEVSSDDSTVGGSAVGAGPPSSAAGGYPAASSSAAASGAPAALVVTGGVDEASFPAAGSDSPTARTTPSGKTKGD